MDKQELEKLEQLVDYIRKWCDENHSYKQSIPFGQILRVVSLQAAAIDELTKHGGFMPQRTTIEEKVANAVFYVEGGITYTIEYSMVEEGYFAVSSVDDQRDDLLVFFSDIPADAYFLGTVRL